MTTAYFRALLLLSILSGILAVSIDAIFPSLLPASIAQAVEDEPLHPLFDSVPALVILLVLPIVLMIASTIGLFLLKPWARAISFYSTIYSLAATPFLGVAASSGWSNALLAVSAYSWGAVLALAYFSSISEKFTSSGASNG